MLFTEFLQKYSSLNNEFINDFHTIYNPDNPSDDFLINLDVANKWLGSAKCRLKNTLIKSYVKNMDYTISKLQNTKKISKSNPEIILLTSDCFKQLCLVSKTTKAREVRTYFIEVEKLLNKYKDYIIKEMKSTINILENNQKEPQQNVKGVVYVLRSFKDIDGIYRLGQTEKFKQRIANYNSANSDNVKVLYIFETKNSKKVQDCVIAQIKEKRYKKRKDFYQIDLNLLKQMIKDCDCFTLKYKGKLDKQIGGSDNEKVENYYLYLQRVI